MFKKIASLFSPKETPTTEIEALYNKIAVAALLVEAARIDEAYTDEEKQIIDRALASKFDLTPDAASALRTKGEEAQSNAVDIHRFSKIAKQMPMDEKIDLLEAMWTIVLSDGERDTYEDTLIRRICGLIYVDDRASGEARQRVEAALKKSGE